LIFAYIAMFDLTKEIKIEKQWQLKYRLFRVLVYLFFLTGVLIFFIKLFFPSENFSFDFRSPNATKNTLTDPRVDENPANRGAVDAGKKLLFDTGFRGDSQNYFEAVLKIVPEKGSQLPDGTAQVRKSFRAFLYPAGNPAGFKDGDLISSQENYFIVSEGKLRRFSSLKIIRELGYQEGAFSKAQGTDLSYNESGEDINNFTYPSGALFKIGEIYYQLEGKVLRPFISEKAYLSRYSINQAIVKEEKFFENFELSKNYIGFAEGTLLSFDITAYVIEGDTIRPVPNPETFLAMGYSWDDLVAADADEIGIYEKGELFRVSSLHPDGTIFFAEDSGKYYLIADHQKREIKSPAILESYLRKNPIKTEENPLTAGKKCEFKELFGFGQNSSCQIDISDITNFPGNNFQYELSFNSPVQLETLEVEYRKKIGVKNIVETLVGIKNRLLIQYGKTK
jgi:hypothetical protein